MDGSVNGGNSGGPIINQKGEVVGVVTLRRYIDGDPMDELAEQAHELANDASPTKHYDNGLVVTVRNNIAGS